MATKKEVIDLAALETELRADPMMTRAHAVALQLIDGLRAGCILLDVSSQIRVDHPVDLFRDRVGEMSEVPCVKEWGKKPMKCLPTDPCSFCRCRALMGVGGLDPEAAAGSSPVEAKAGPGQIIVDGKVWP